jgi:hypothetical protein
MHCPTLRRGTFNNIELSLLPDANGEHNDSAHECQPAEHWRNINVLVFICAGVDRPDIKDVFSMGVRESLIGKGKTTQYNEKNATPNEGFHVHGDVG